MADGETTEKYIGRLCAVCKTKIQEGDVVKVCPACGFPHHKECWEKNKGCAATVDCREEPGAAPDTNPIEVCNNCGTKLVETQQFCPKCGTPKHIPKENVCENCGTELQEDHVFCPKCGQKVACAADDEQSQREVQIYCTQCGTLNHISDSFCTKCGASLMANTSEQKNTDYRQYADYRYKQETIIEDDVVYLIGSNAEYYVPKFQELKQMRKKASWNWAAFWVTPYWFIYRKMYGYGYGMLAVALLLPFLALHMYLVLAIFANYIYMCELEKKARRASMMNEPFKSQYLDSNRDTNLLFPALTVIIPIVIVYIFIFSFA